jgi:hypothetical protein
MTTTLPKTIRRRCSSDLFDAIVQGDRTFDLRADNEDIQVGDYYLFVEERDDDQPVRQIHRLVSYVVRLNDVLDEDQRKDPGLVAVSFVAVEHNRLESVLVNNAVIIALALGKYAGNVSVLDGPACIPYLSTDGLDAQQIADHLNVPKWPDGQYSIVFTARILSPTIQDGSQTLEINYSGLIIMCHVADAIGSKLVCVDYRFLIDGVLRDLKGQTLEPIFTEQDDGQPNGTDQTILDRITAATE